jgi:glycerol-3-phosphate dehydrogenase (NAD(P)+)
MTRAAVIGAGAWGTALADVLARNGVDACLWAREADVVAGVNDTHENVRFLAGHQLSAALRASSNLDDAVRDAAIVCLATPSQHLRTILRSLAPSLARGAILCIASKGIEQGSLALMSDVVDAEAPAHPLVALSGPSFASEVAEHRPTAIVAASIDIVAAEKVQDAFSNSHLRIYTHDDVIGVELGGSLKNVMAVAAGICEGAGLGFNARAALITRGLAEMIRLGVALGAQPATFAGLAGIGDLVLTCTAPLSRNHSVGLAIGQGMTLDEALAGKETVAEGVATTQSAHALAIRQGVEMPIVSTVHRILFDGYNARRALSELMSRELRSEQDA